MINPLRLMISVRASPTSLSRKIARDQIQGYYFSRLMPADQFIDFIAKGPTLT